MDMKRYENEWKAYGRNRALHTIPFHEICPALIRQAHSTSCFVSKADSSRPSSTNFRSQEKIAQDKWIWPSFSSD